MGCGACSNSQISDSKRPLHQRLIDKLNCIKGSSFMSDLRSFVSLEEIKMIENTTETLQQSIRLEELNKLAAGQRHLLSPQRRIAWKLAIYEHIKPGQIQSFCEHPTTINQNTKNRFYQISLDVKRTFPTVNQLNKDHLTNVLENLTINFQGIGYTQGMNFYVGFLLLCGFTPQESYQFFIRLSYNKRFLLIRNFSQNFQNVNCCVKIMEEVMKDQKNIVLNRIMNKIESFGMNLFLFVFSWILTYFLYNFNLKASLLIWDYLLLFPSAASVPQTSGIQNAIKNDIFGSGFVNAINLSLKILESLSQELLQCNELSQMMSILRHDSIQVHLDEVKTEEIISKCKVDPFIDWNLFKQKSKQKDEDLFKIINDIESPQVNSGHFVSFMNSCKHAKRSAGVQFQ